MQRQNLALLQMINYMNGGPPPPTKNIKISNPLFTQQQIDRLDPNIKKIYQEVFTFEEPIDYQLLTNMPFQIKPTPMPICNKTFVHNENVYRCLDCMIHQSSVQCQFCFENSDHKTHRYQKISAAGGNCDCGNIQAYKQQGFCTSHPGKADPVRLQQNQTDQFNFYFGHLFSWYFILLQRQEKKGDQLGVLIAKTFLKLNKQSLYYNTLTSQFLCQTQYIEQINGEKKTFSDSRMNRLFSIPYPTSSSAKRQFCKVYLQMFSLTSFKYELTKSYIIAYNIMPQFENAEFKDLFIQLLGNVEVLDKCLKEGVFVNIYGRRFFEQKYYDNLNFLTSIKNPFTKIYFKALINKSFMRAPFLQRIQNDVENATAYIHQGISNVNDNQNYYMVVSEKVLKIIYQDKETLMHYLKQLRERIQSRQYESYKKNKVMLPYHRNFAIGLLFYFDGDFSAISSKRLLYEFQNNEEEFTYFLLRCAKAVLKCFWEFSLSYCRRCYFDEYIHLYVKTASMVMKADLLLLRQCAYLLSQLKKGDKLQDLIISFLKQQENKVRNKEILIDSEEEQLRFQQQGKQGFHFRTIRDRPHYLPLPRPYQRQKLQKENEIFEYYQRASAFLGILIQSIISNRQELTFSNDNEITGQVIKQLSRQSLQSFINLVKVVTLDDNKTFLKHFIGKNYSQVEINKVVQLDNESKKLKARQIKGQSINFSFYQSLPKANNFFPNQLQNAVPNKIQLSNISENLSKVLLGEKVVKFIIQLEKKLIRDDKVMIPFVNQLAKVYFLKNQKNEQIFKFMKLLKSSSSDTEFLRSKYLKPFIDSIDLFHNEDFDDQQNKRKKKIKQIKQKKIQALKQKQNKFMEELQKQQIKVDIEQQQTNENQDKCLICQQHNPQKLLCQIVRMSNQNYFLSQFGIGKNQIMVSMTSCNHLIHFECFADIFGNKQAFQCPFCKRLANVVLPISQKINDPKIEKIIDLILTRLEVISNVFNLGLQEVKYITFQDNEEQIPIKKQEKKQQIKEQNPCSIRVKILTNLFVSLIQLIGFHGLQDYQVFIKIHQKLSKGLLLLLKRFYQTSQKQEQETYKNELILKYKKWNQVGKKNQNFFIFNFIYQKLQRIITQNEKLETQSILKSSEFEQQNKILTPIKKLIEKLIFRLISLEYQSQIKQQFQKNFWSSKLRKIFFPPQNIYQLMKLRDKYLQKCKYGHEIIMCCLCGQICCFDCRKFVNHTLDFHAKRSVYFSYMKGTVLYDAYPFPPKIKNIYENSIGKSWQTTIDPQGYKLDKFSYEKVLKQIINNTYSEKVIKQPRRQYR